MFKLLFLLITVFSTLINFVYAGSSDSAAAMNMAATAAHMANVRDTERYGSLGLLGLFPTPPKYPLYSRNGAGWCYHESKWYNLRCRNDRNYFYYCDGFGTNYYNNYSNNYYGQNYYSSYGYGNNGYHGNYQNQYYG